MDRPTTDRPRTLGPDDLQTYVAPSRSEARDVRILVVDDEPFVRRVVARLIQRGGWTPATADGGPEALGLLRDETIHLLLTDVRMPGMDGPTLVREARRLQPSLPVLYMTGHAGDGVDPTLLQDPVLEKPFASGRLYQALEEILGARLAPTAEVGPRVRPGR
jgi:two-component system cell cycle sensor histidine kinase/response regulator CckA